MQAADITDADFAAEVRSVTARVPMRRTNSALALGGRPTAGVAPRGPRSTSGPPAAAAGGCGGHAAASAAWAAGDTAGAAGGRNPSAEKAGRARGVSWGARRWPTLRRRRWTRGQWRGHSRPRSAEEPSRTPAQRSHRGLRWPHRHAGRWQLALCERQWAGARGYGCCESATRPRASQAAGWEGGVEGGGEAKGGPKEPLFIATNLPFVGN